MSDLRPPSVDALMRSEAASVLVARFGRPALLATIRVELAQNRHSGPRDQSSGVVLDCVADTLTRRFAPTQRSVFNLTGTVLHTNLGRAPLPQEAANAAAEALANPTTVEFDLLTGRRGKRDDHVRDLLRQLTGAEDATVVNNNAAAVLLMLNTLALGREVSVSRGELIEIGGSFRIPDVITRAGAKLIEVGTTNRTHAKDFRAAIGPGTATIMRVHQANFAIEGFTAAVALKDLAAIAREHAIPLVDDLGSGSLVDLAQWHLPHEPMPQESLADGADLVSFSGDKLLGGPQAGLIVGRADLIARLNANPMKRALRLDKARLAALEAVLRLYLNPDRLATSLPALRLLTRAQSDIQETAQAVRPALAAFCPTRDIAIEDCRSQIGSGALPVDLLPSHAVTIAGSGLDGLSATLRQLPKPVIGRIANGRLWLDCRCLEADQHQAFRANLDPR